MNESAARHTPRIRPWTTNREHRTPIASCERSNVCDRVARITRRSAIIAHASRSRPLRPPSRTDLQPTRAPDKKMVHRGIPGNAARILRKKYCSSRYP
ncbi:hypothetical protein WJ28_00005 [Burkholderia thailandensis]|nr:hypothetical protein WJ28_00005 [Burkholderia thailandensis]